MNFSKLLYRASIFYLCIFWLLMLFGNSINYEFRDINQYHKFNLLLLVVTPFVVLQFAYGSTKEYSKSIKVLRRSFTLLTLFVQCTQFFISGISGTWSTNRVLFEHKNNGNRKIEEKLYNGWVTSNSDTRIVELEPFTPYFWHIVQVDTTAILKNEWKPMYKSK